jgi:hypothetical protein
MGSLLLGLGAVTIIERRGWGPYIEVRVWLYMTGMDDLGKFLILYFDNVIVDSGLGSKCYERVFSKCKIAHFEASGILRKSCAILYCRYLRFLHFAGSSVRSLYSRGIMHDHSLSR